MASFGFCPVGHVDIEMEVDGYWKCWTCGRRFLDPLETPKASVSPSEGEPPKPVTFRLHAPEPTTEEPQ